MKRLLLLVLALGLGSAAARACPGCAENVVVAQGQSGEVLAGFSWSVLFLLGAVLGSMGGLGALIVRAVQRIDRERSSR